MTVHHIVGASVPRKEGWDKVTGAARYVDDMTLPGMLYGATLRRDRSQQRAARHNQKHFFCFRR